MHSGEVTHADSPGRFYCRTMEDKAKFNEFKERLCRWYDHYAVNPADGVTDCQDIIPVVVVVKRDGVYWRAIPRPVGRHYCIYDLVDTGRHVALRDHDPIFALTAEFSLEETPPFAFRCHLADVVSSTPGLPSTWSDDAADLFKKETQKVLSLFIQARGDVVLRPDGYQSLPVELHFEERVTEAFRLGLPVKVTMSTKLLRAGLAMSVLEAEERRMLEEEESSPASMRRDDEESEDIRTAWADDDVGCPTDEDEAGHTVVSSAVARWPGPTIPEEATFLARYQAVSELGQVYLQLKKDVETVRRIRRSLRETHQLDEAMDDDVKDDWDVGEECVAFFERTEEWIRARVIKVFRELGQVAVVYVDYGNVCRIGTDRLRVARDFGCVPILAVRAVVAGAAPLYGQWRSSDLDFVHDGLDCHTVGWLRVTKVSDGDELPLRCKIEVRRKRGEGDDEEWVDFADRMARYGIAKRSSPDEAKLFEDSEYLDDAYGIEGVRRPGGADVDVVTAGSSSFVGEGTAGGSSLVECPYLREEVVFEPGQMVPIRIETVQENGDLCVHVGDDSLIRYHAMLGALRKATAGRPPILKVLPGAAVAVKYRDGYYYRGLVVDVGCDRPAVKFVDVGDSENVNRRKIKELPEDILSVPVFAHRVRLTECMSPDDVKRAFASKHLFLRFEASLEEAGERVLAGKLFRSEQERRFQKVCCSVADDEEHREEE